jgi:hypothetical protein
MEDAMRRLLLLVSLGASLLLSGCFAAFAPVVGSMALGIGSQKVLEDGAAKHRADRCYKVEVDARKKSTDAAFIRKELTAARCPLS